jgi:hypothetical protein
LWRAGGKDTDPELGVECPIRPNSNLALEVKVEVKVKVKVDVEGNRDRDQPRGRAAGCVVARGRGSDDCTPISIASWEGRLYPRWKAWTKGPGGEGRLVVETRVQRVGTDAADVVQA